MSSTSRPWKSAGNVKRMSTLGLRLDRARVHLAVGHVVAAVGDLPRASLDDDAEIGVRADDPQLACAAELAGPPQQLLARRQPVGDRVARPARRGTRGRRSARTRRIDMPASWACAGVGKSTPHQRSSCAAIRAQRRLVSSRVAAISRWCRSGARAAQRARVLLGPDRDDRVDEVDLLLRDRRDELELLVRALAGPGPPSAPRARRSRTGRRRRAARRGTAPSRAGRPTAGVSMRRTLPGCSSSE